MDALQVKILDGVKDFNDNKAIKLLRGFTTEEMLKNESFATILNDLIILNHRGEFFFRKEDVEDAKNIPFDYVFVKDKEILPVNNLFTFKKMLNYVGYHWDKTQYLNSSIERHYRKDVKRYFHRWKAIIEKIGGKINIDY